MHIILSSLLACGEEEVHVSYPESSYSYPEAVFDKYYTFLKEKGYVAFDGNLEKIFVLCQGGPYELRLDGDKLGLRVQYVPLGYPGSVFQGILLHETIKEKWDDAVMYSFSDVNVNGLAEHYYSHSRRPIVPFLIHEKGFDYKGFGFKCGLECHQQIESNKLFCSCPSLVNDDAQADIFFSRKLRAAAGETGLIDQAAAYEMQKGKTFQYDACSSSSCLVEFDEEPPHLVNMHALKVALEVSLLLHAKIVEEIHFMRKTVVDGSNVSGFQRTALIAMNGYIDTSQGRVTIPSICLEEEAAKKLEGHEHLVKFRLDRLGVDLVEIATDASIQDPEHAKEVASLLGMILRSTGKVKRGLGTIRQDVNISIAGHPRVEVKGFQELRYMPTVIQQEITRQIQEAKKG